MTASSGSPVQFQGQGVAVKTAYPGVNQQRTFRAGNDKKAQNGGFQWPKSLRAAKRPYTPYQTSCAFLLVEYVQFKYIHQAKIGQTDKKKSTPQLFGCGVDFTLAWSMRDSYYSRRFASRMSWMHASSNLLFGFPWRRIHVKWESMHRGTLWMTGFPFSPVSWCSNGK